MCKSIVRVVAVAAVATLSGWLVGCTEEEDSRFAAGAFPPVLSDTDYHARSWNRGDCLTCHETGVVDAPKMEHRSLPAVTKQAKCRTCHVFVAGEPPQ